MGAWAFWWKVRFCDFVRRFNSNEPIQVDSTVYGMPKTWRLQIGTLSKHDMKSKVRLGFPDDKGLIPNLPAGDACFPFKPLQSGSAAGAQDAMVTRAIHKCPTATSIAEYKFIVEEKKRLQEYPFVDFHGSIRFVLQYASRA